MPVPATAQAMMAPKGPVAVAKRPGRLKMPAPTIEPITMAVSEKRDSLPADPFAIVYLVMQGRRFRPFAG
ncbi:hypothetical protein GCM10028812_17160 [Ancylobacter sonchi]